MTDIPNSPYLDRPLRTLRQIEQQRWEVVSLLASACSRVRAVFGEASEQAAACDRAYSIVGQSWRDAQREARIADAAAAPRAA